MEVPDEKRNGKMKRNILILEDKEAHREALYKILSDLAEDITIYTASDVQKAYQITMSDHIHLFLLDIILRPEQSGDVTGLQFAQEIRKVKKYQFTPIVFITSLADPRLYSYSHLHCWSYIEKPLNPEQVRKTVLEALHFPVNEDLERSVYFRKDGIIYAKKIKDILYIENSRRRILLHCRNDILEIPYKSCEEILEELDSKLFVQCSRHIIINKTYLEQIDFVNRYIRLKHVDDLLEIGTVMKNRLREELE